MVRRLAIVPCGVLCAVAVVLLATGAGARPARHAAAVRSGSLSAQLRSFERAIAGRGGLLPGRTNAVAPGRRPLLAPRVAGGTCYASADACSIVPCAVFAQAQAAAGSPPVIQTAASVITATAVSGAIQAVARPAPGGAMLQTVRPVRPSLRSSSGDCRTHPGKPPRSRWVSTTG